VIEIRGSWEEGDQDVVWNEEILGLEVYDACEGCMGSGWVLVEEEDFWMVWDICPNCQGLGY
jgi:DnaJ-class molecular chaperone